MIHLTKNCTHCDLGITTKDHWYVYATGQVLCRLQAKQNRARWYKANKQKLLDYNNSWRKDNPERTRSQGRRYDQKNYGVNIIFTLKKNLRKRLTQALKRGTKTGSAIQDLGCSVPELKIHLESQFQSDMNWNNYGQWHVDHILPLARFDLLNREELVKACHYSNLQPLWASDNIRKGAK